MFKSLRPLLIGLLPLTVGLALAGGIASLPVPVAAHPVHHVVRITEESSDWNCITMGNHRCGAGWSKVPPATDALLSAQGHRHCIQDWSVVTTDWTDSVPVACPDGFVLR